MMSGKWDHLGGTGMSGFVAKIVPAYTEHKKSPAKSLRGPCSRPAEG